LNIRLDNTYELHTQYLDREEKATLTEGRLHWNDSGNVISLDFRGNTREFAVQEGRLVLLNIDGSRPEPLSDAYVLTQFPASQAQDKPLPLTQTLKNNHWTLESVTNRSGKRHKAFSSRQKGSIVFRFANSDLHIQGACNTLRGHYTVTTSSEGKKLEVGPMASTMMACEGAASETDSILSKLVSNPLQVQVTSRRDPVLRLTSADNQILTLKGQATPESLYGKPTIVFLEVSSKLEECRHASGGRKDCLIVRDRNFNQYGLASGDPGKWRTLPNEIVGFEHTSGQSSVLRVKQYTRPNDNLYVLDLVVESRIEGE
jgi:heat shock protein HslJ